MEDIKISVIIPVYKVEPYLKKCVDSVRAQTYKNLEIILVDDCSPDNCGAMCDEFAKEDARIRVVHHEKNKGLADARNSGMSIMTGECMIFVDSDDWIEPDMYETLLELMLRYDADVACCNWFVSYPDGRDQCGDEDTECFLNLNRIETLREMITSCQRIYYYCWNKLFRTSKIRDKRFRSGFWPEDEEAMPRFIYCVDRVVYTGKPLYHWYQSPNSLTRAPFTKRMFGIIDVKQSQVEFFRERCPELSERAKVNYVDGAIHIIDEAGESGFEEQRRAYWEELMAFVRANPEVKYPRWIKRKLDRIRLGLPLSDLLFRFEGTSLYRRYVGPAREFVWRCRRYVKRHLRKR